MIVTLVAALRIAAGRMTTNTLWEWLNTQQIFSVSGNVQLAQRYLPSPLVWLRCCSLQHSSSMYSSACSPCKHVALTFVSAASVYDHHLTVSNRSVNADTYPEHQLAVAAFDVTRARDDKTAFMSYLCDQIRNPLFAVISMTDFALHKRSSLDPEVGTPHLSSPAI